MAKAWIPNLSFRQQLQVPHDSQVWNFKSTSISEGCDHFLVIFKGLQRPCQHQTGWAYKLCKFRKNFMAFLMYLAETNFNQENGSSSLTSAKDSGLHVPAVPECRALSRPKKIQQPDSLYAYLVCFCGVLCNLIMFGCSYSFGLLFPLLLEEFEEGKAKTGNLENTSKMEPFCGL